MTQRGIDHQPFDAWESCEKELPPVVDGNSPHVEQMLAEVATDTTSETASIGAALSEIKDRFGFEVPEVRSSNPTHTTTPTRSSVIGWKSWLIRFVFAELRRQVWNMLLIAASGFVCVATFYLMIWPSYQNPIARLYTSKLGYSSVLRKMGKPFPVKSAAAVMRDIEVRLLGEGLVQSDPVQIPMIGMAGIVSVNVQEGDRVKAGDVIIVLDDKRILNKLNAAKATLATARAEVQRVKLGSVYNLDHERPERDKIRLEALRREAKIADRQLARYRELLEKNMIAEENVLQQELLALKANELHQELQFGIKVAEAGTIQSQTIAQSAVIEAELQVEFREAEINDYRCIAPADGIVERVLVHAGEYNQDPGRPGVMLACGLWFELYLDQTALGQVHEGSKVEVRLAAFPDRVFDATVYNIRTLVNFSLGGPETNRPNRPLGTGAPEWPATFSVRARFQNPTELVVPGLTGFGRVVTRRKAVCVPQGTVMGVSANRGIVYVVTEMGDRCTPRNVTMGATDAGWTEIVDGLSSGEIVVTDGYQVLLPDDRIAPSRIDADDQTDESPSNIGKVAPVPKGTPS